MTGAHSNNPNYPVSKHTLDVPYAEKDEAKKLGAKWDAEIKKWYLEICHFSDHDFRALARWTKEIDKRFLECPEKYRAIALLRGAMTDEKTGKLFVPYWFAIPSCTHEHLQRLAYWLPDCPEFHKTDERGLSPYNFYKRFSNPKDAAINIAMSGYTPIEMYLPEEREAMDKLCSRGDQWYLCKAGNAYYRLKIWDTC